MISPGRFDDVVIHVGYHKAASTLLQRALFVESAGVWSPWSQVHYHREVMLNRPDRGWSDRVRAAFIEGIQDAREAGLVPVLTCEGLSGDMWRIGQANGYGNFHVADVLADAFPGARILLVHREQASMIASLYKHSVRSHWATSLSSFLDQTPEEAGMAPLLNLGYLEYSWLLHHYQSRFGAESVTAMPFELLLSDREEWARRLSSVIGRAVDASWFAGRENGGMSSATVQVKARLNMLIPQTANPDATRTARLISTLAHEVDRVVPSGLAARSEAHLRARIEASIRDRFHADNSRVFALIGESWAHLGYATGP